MSTETAEKMPNGHVNGGSKIKETIEETTFSSKTTSSSSSSSTNGQSKTTNGSASPNIKIEEDLKIIEHLKTIAKSNDEQRKIFLNKIVSESSSTSTSSSTTGSKEEASPKTLKANEVISPTPNQNVNRMVLNEKKLIFKEEHSNNVQESRTLRSPVAPPKPPMLSRTRSIGIGDQRMNGSAASSPTSPPGLPTSPVPTLSPIKQNGFTLDPPITSAKVIASTIPEPTKIETVQIEETIEPPSKDQSEMTASVTSASTPTMDSSTAKPCEKPISAKHYEHLIEELKCPGCASPMKAPILLCETGHSICEQCTRILMMCPLCKEPFTKQRSLTVEAMASKAHFRCSNAAGGCTVRLQKDLLSWHEKQCVYKPMKCFMGRVWGDCDWDGREIQWKDHIESEHANKVFTIDSMDLIWDMAGKQKPLTGYYVFQVFDEMFNFYEIHDRDRILFTMTCTSSIKDKKHYYAYEVTIMHPDNEALAITQKFPVHSEYDKDILMEGTCVTVSMCDLAKFIDEEKLLHYRIRILQVNSPRKTKVSSNRTSTTPIPPDFLNTQIVGGNLKSVPADIIVTRKQFDPDAASLTPSSIAPPSSSEDEIEKIRRQYNKKIQDGDESESDPEFEAFIAKRWGTPQLHFNRKYLKNTSNDCSHNEDAISPLRETEKTDLKDDDRSSIASTSYKKKVSNTLRKSFRSLKTEISEIKYFGKKSPDKLSPN